jgi:hypothetical protein
MKIRNAWRKREERVPSLLLVYVMHVKESPERVRARQLAVQAPHKRLADKDDRKAANNVPQPIAPLNPFRLELFALRGSQLRSETWGRQSEQAVRGLLPGLTPGKDCDSAIIEIGNLKYDLLPQATAAAGSRFRRVVIMPRDNDPDIVTTSVGELLLLNYRSALLAKSGRFPLDPALDGKAYESILALEALIDANDRAIAGRGNAALVRKSASFQPNAIPRRPPPEVKVVPKEGVPQAGREPQRVIVRIAHQPELWLDPSRDYLVTAIVRYRAADRRVIDLKTECEYEKAPAPLDWVPKKITTTRLAANGQPFRTEECVTVDWAAGNDKVPNELFEFDYPDGTFVVDSTDVHRQGIKCSIAWQGKLIPVSMDRPYADSLEWIKRAHAGPPDGKR